MKTFVPVRAAVFFVKLAVVSIALGQAPALLVGDAPVLVPDSAGSFDFLQIDSANHRLLAAHTGNSTLDVFDLADGSLIKHVPTGKAQDVSVDTAAEKYYVSVSQEKKVCIIDRKTLEKTGEISLPGEADAAVFDPKNHCFYVGHDDGPELWVVDMNEKSLTAAISIPEGPEIVIYDAASDRIFQNIKSNDTLLMIDPATNKVLKTWPTAPAKHPHGLVINSKTHHLLCAGANGKLAVLDATSGELINSIDIAQGVDQVAFDASSEHAYCAGGKGEMSIVEDSPTGATLLGNIKTPPGAKTVACDAVSHAVWIAYAEGKNSYIRRFAAK